LFHFVVGEDNTVKKPTVYTDYNLNIPNYDFTGLAALNISD